MSEVAESFPMAFLVHQVDEGIAQVGLAVEVDGQVEEIILPKVSPRIPKSKKLTRAHVSRYEPIQPMFSHVFILLYSGRLTSFTYQSIKILDTVCDAVNQVQSKPKVKMDQRLKISVRLSRFPPKPCSSSKWRSIDL